MQRQQTNYQAHQRLAQRNSRRLTIAFILFVVLSAVSYWVLSYVMVANGVLPFFMSITGEFTRSPAIVLASIVATICALLIIWGYYRCQQHLSNYHALDIASALGAKALPEKLTLRQQQYRNVVEEMAIASGMSCPIILFTPKDDSINGFVTASHKNTIAICVSQGALDYLKREELQALVAHEFGHIYNRDVFLNNRLIAVLDGFFVVRNMLQPGDDDYYDDDDDSDFFYDDDNDDNKLNIFGLFGVVLLGASMLMIFFGRLLQAAFSRQREWLADAHAVQYTRNKDALAGVFKKAMALQHMAVNTPEVEQDKAHFLFVNYQNNWLSTHPPLDKRLARYGQPVFAEELKSLAYQLKQYKHQNTQAEQIATQNTNGSNSNQAQTMQFVKEKFYPLLAIREYQQTLKQQPLDKINTDTVAAMVIAQFAQLSHRPLEHLAKQLQWNKKQQALIQSQIDLLQKSHPTTHIQTFLHYLPKIQSFSAKKQLMKQIQAIIKADKSFDICEMCYLLCLRKALTPTTPETERTLNFQDYHDEIILACTIIACLSDDDTSKQKANYHLMRTASLPMVSIDYVSPTIDNNTVTTFYHALQTIAMLKRAYRRNLFATFQKNMHFDGKISTEQNHLLHALRYLLN